MNTTPPDTFALLDHRTGPPAPALLKAIDRCLRADKGRESVYVHGWADTGHTAAWEKWTHTAERGPGEETTLALVVRNKSGDVVQPASKSGRPKTVLSFMADARIYADPEDRMRHIKEQGYAVTSAKSTVIVQPSDNNDLANDALALLNRLLTTDLTKATVEHTKTLDPKPYLPSEEGTVTDEAKFDAILHDPHDERWALPTEFADSTGQLPKLTLKRTMLSKGGRPPAAGPDWDMFGDMADFARQGAPDHTPQALKVLLHDGASVLPAKQLHAIKPGATALVELAVQGWYLNNRNKHKPQHTLVQWVQSVQIFSNGTGGRSGAAGGINLDAAIADAEKAETHVADPDIGIAVPRAEGQLRKKPRRA